MEPAQRSLNDPTRLAETAAMGPHPPSDFGFDPLSMEQLTVFIVIVTAISLNKARLTQWAPPLAANGCNGLNQGYKLGDIVAVGTREQHGKRDTPCLGDQVMLGAGTRAIGGIGSCF